MRVIYLVRRVRIGNNILLRFLAISLRELSLAKIRIIRNYIRLY